MITTNRESVVAKAEHIYESQLKSQLERTHLHSFLAIEPESGDYFVGATLSDVANAARLAHPDRQSYVMRIGHSAALHIGSGQ